MAFLEEYGLFLAETVTIVVAILVTLAGVIVLTARSRHRRSAGHIQVRHLNRRYEEMALALRGATQSKKAFKQSLKAFKKHHHQERRRVYVLDFEGDIRASALGSLREEISAVLSVARGEDEVVVRLESGGGMVHAYGLAASQLDRVRARGIPLTVTVDKIAASGGYMMACVADKLMAAPFAIIGSIGVVAQLPNFHRLLKKHDVDYELFTAGDY
ncbi:MAG: protease SohB, partial [Candidatus Competibacteraceae bacterium]|nr:protease SohB [Candidatus Competibacteraceae bacterium]